MKLTIYNTIARFAGAALFAAAAVWTARADYSSTLLSHNPLGYWRFDETTASSPLNIITNASPLESLGTGYVVSSGADTPNLGQPGLIGTSVRFNNPGNTVANCDSKIEVPWVSLNNTLPPFSIEFWTKPNSLGGDATGFCPLSNFDPDYNGEATRDGWLFYLPASGAWNFRLGSHSGYALSLVVTNGFAVAGSWEHIVATWDGLNAKVYGNGVVIGGAFATVDGSAPGNNPPYYGNSHSIIRFGGSPLNGNNGIFPSAIAETIKNGNRGYDGWMQQVAVYTNVLSPAQVGAHYLAASTNNSGYVAQIKADAPVGFWTMNDAPVASPTSPYPKAANSGSLGSAADATNFPGALVAQTGPGYAGFGADTNAVFYDGVNGYMQVDDSPGLHFTGNITLAAWVKPMEQDFYRDIIAHGIDGNTAETFLRISTYDSTILGGTFYEIGSSDGQTYYDSAISPIPAGDIGNWVFLVGTYDGSNWNLYRNGQLVATLPPEDQGGLGAFDVTNQWTIGSRGPDANFAGQGSFFGGSICQPAIFNTALSSSDVLALYNAAQVPPVITEAPVNPGVLFEGSSFTLSVWAEGNAPLTYQWYKGATQLSGQTATNYTKTGAIQTDSGTYSVVVNNSYGSVTSSVAVVVIPSKPVITSQPAPVTRYVGFPYSFSVTAIGSQPIGYQWLTNGVPVPGASSATYSNLAQLSFAGNFTVVLSNALGSATSNPALFTPLAIPSGYPAAVTASGPIAYWRLDELSGTVAHDIVGGNDGTYNLATLGLPGYSALDSDTAAGFNGTGSYVGNISGTAINFVNNANFSLEAWVNAQSGQNDQASVIAKGIGNNGTVENEQFSIDVSGGIYRFFTTRAGVIIEADASEGPNGTWQHIVGVYDGQNLLGGGAKMYIYVNGQPEGSVASPASPYQSTITSPVSIGSKRTGNDPAYDGTFNGTVDEVAVYNYALSGSTINAHYAAAYGSSLAPVIDIEPVPTTNYVGLPVTLSVGAYGTQPLTYQWFQGATQVGGNSANYTVSAVGLGDQGNYHVNISNSVGNTNSVTVPLVVLAPPTTPPSIPGLVLHLPFNGNLTDVTGRGNNGTGLHSTWNTNSSTGTTNVATPAAANPSFFYTDSPFPGTNGLHFTTMAAGNSAKALDAYYVKLGLLPDLQFGSDVDFTVSYWVRTPLGYGLSGDANGNAGGGDLPFFTTSVQSLGGFGFDFTTPYAFGTQSPPAPGSAAETTAAAVAGSWGLSIYGGSAVGIRLNGAVGAINDGSYHNVINIVNRATGIVTVYLDGVKVQNFAEAGSTTLKAAGNIDSGNSATVGQDPTGLYGELGSFDLFDLGVWRRALSPLEASSIYAAGFNSFLSFTSGYVPPESIQITSTAKSGNSVTIGWSATPQPPAGYYTYSVLSKLSLSSGIWTTNVTGISTTTYTDNAATGGQKFYRVTSP